MFSKTCEYAIKATLYVAHQSQLNNRVGLKDIARAIASPEAFTAKILQTLARNEILKSIKGPTGGFEIDQVKREKIKLRDIVFAIDGNTLFKGCGLGLDDCNSLKPCPMHHKFLSIRQEIIAMLESTSLEDLASDVNNGVSFLR